MNEFLDKSGISIVCFTIELGEISGNKNAGATSGATQIQSRMKSFVYQLVTS